MTRAQYTVRLPRSVDAALCRAAMTRQTTAYALLQQAVRIGLATLSGEQTAAPASTGMAREIGALSARLTHVERLAERGLYVGCAAYTFARAAAGSRADDSKLTDQINAAFARQLAHAGER